MKRRILSLAVCVVMLVSAFTMAACSGSGSDDLLKVVYGNDGNTSLNDKSMTITIFTIKDPSTTDEAIKEVEAALSEISEKKYNTKIDLVLLPEETYASIVFNKLESSLNSYHQWVSINETPKTSDEQKLNQNPEFANNYTGDRKLNIANKMPSEAQSANIDIFLVYNPKADSPVLDENSEYYSPALANNGMFDVLYESRAIAELDADKKITNGTFSVLKTIAPTSAMNFVTRANYISAINDIEMTDSNKQIFGIPNNYVYGSYDYVMFNISATIPGTDILGGVNLIDKPSNKEGLAMSAEAREEVVKKLEELVADKLDKNGFDRELNQNWSDEKKAEWQNEYHNACMEVLGVRNIERTFTSYEEYVATAESESFAIGYITGESSLEELFKENGALDVYKTGVNYVGEEYATESMFCVNAGALKYIDEYGNETVDKTRITRCLEVLMLINNNAEFRNILQYGVKDTHYKKNVDGTVSVAGTPENKYVMYPEWTGNMYILNVSDSMSKAMQRMAANDWTLAKIQSQETLGKKSTEQT